MATAPIVNEVSKLSGIKKGKSESWMQFVVGLLAFAVLIIVCTVAGRAFYHWKYAPDMKLPNLVTRIRSDIDTINNDKANLGWEVEEAEVEVNFVAKDSSNNTTDLKTVSTEIGSERENSQRLLLKLRKIHPASEARTHPDMTSAAPSDSPRKKH